MTVNNQASVNIEFGIQRYIYNIINELKRTNSDSRVYRLLLSLDNLEKIITKTNLDIKYPKEYTFEKEKYDVDKLIIRMAKDYYAYETMYRNFNEKICNISDYIQRKYIIGNYNVFEDVVQLEESIQLSKEFLKYYDQGISDYFDEIYNSHRSLVCDIDSDGISFLGNHIMQSYIIIKPYLLIDDSLTIVHELAHAYLGDKTRYMSDCEECLFSINNMHEVYSIFIELVMEDYLIHNNIHKEDVMRTHNLRTKVFLNTLDKLKEEDYIECEAERYSYGYLLAYHFFKQYKKNPKQAKENIYNLMIDSKTYDRNYLFNN